VNRAPARFISSSSSSSTNPLQITLLHQHKLAELQNKALHHNTIMSYADMAAKGPKQSDAEVSKSLSLLQLKISFMPTTANSESPTQSRK